MNFFLVCIFFLFCFFLVLIERKTYIPYIKWIFIIPFCLIIANRSIKVPDTEAYLDFFNDTVSDLSDLGNFSFEVGFQIFTKLIKFYIVDNVVVYFAIIVIINLLLVNLSVNRIGKLFKSEMENNSGDYFFVGGNRFFRNAVFSILPLTLYVAFFGIYLNAVVLRAGIAISLLLLASTFALKPNKNSFDYFAICMIFMTGFFFHITILIGIFALFIMLSNKKFANKTYLLIWFSIGFFYFANLSSKLGNTVFSFVATVNNFTDAASKISNYEDNVVQTVEGISMKFVFFWIMGFVLIVYKISSNIYYKLLNVYLAGIFIFALFRSVTLIERVTDYFLLFSFIIFYLFLIMQKPYKFWLYFIPIIIIQLVFILRIIN